jgi:non-specific serine/threonine protein kinase
MALLRLGLLRIAQERHDEAAALTEEAFGLYEGMGDTSAFAVAMASIALGNLGGISIRQGNYERAAEYLAEALAQQQAIGFAWGAGFTVGNLGRLAFLRGDLVTAAARYRERLDHARAQGDPWMATWSLIGLAKVALAIGQPERAARLLGAKATLDAVMGRFVEPADREEEARTLAAARAALDEDRFAIAWEEGRALSFEAAVAEARQVGADLPEAIAVVAKDGPDASIMLTPRELDVLRLLVEGRTDREIAAVLFVSRRTAATHVRHVFQELGVGSRAAAAALAVRHGLA